MLVALNEKNQHILAEAAATSSSSQFFCPGCGGKVFIKYGAVIQPHFAHYHQNRVCRLFSEGETAEHLNGKQLLLAWFRNQQIPCQLEAYIPNLKQRPDLLVWLSAKQPLAIEFQCSSISSKAMSERTKGYQKAGYKVWWILGSKFHKLKNLKVNQRLFLRHHQQLGFQLYYLDVAKEVLECFFQMSESEPFKRLSYQTLFFSLTKKNNTLNELKSELAKAHLKWQISTKAIYQKDGYLKTCQYYLNQGRRYTTSEAQAFQSYLYQKSESIYTIPLEVYFPRTSNPFVKTHSFYWRYLILEWIIKKEENNFFTEKEFLSFIKDLLQTKQIRLYSVPQVSQQALDESFLSYLFVLKQFKLLKKCPSNNWMVVRHPTF